MTSSPLGESSAGGPAFRLPDSAGEFRWSADRPDDGARPIDPLAPEQGDAPNAEGAKHWAAWAGFTDEETLDASGDPAEPATVGVVNPWPSRNLQSIDGPQSTEPPRPRARVAGRDPRDGAYTLPALIAILVVTMAASLFVGQGLRWPGGDDPAIQADLAQPPRSSIFQGEAPAQPAVAPPRPAAHRSTPPPAPHPSRRARHLSPPPAAAEVAVVPVPLAPEAPPPPDLTSGAAASALDAAAIEPVPAGPEATSAPAPAPPELAGPRVGAGPDDAASSCGQATAEACISRDGPGQAAAALEPGPGGAPLVEGWPPILSETAAGPDPGIAAQPAGENQPVDTAPPIAGDGPSMSPTGPPSFGPPDLQPQPFAPGL